MGIVLIDPDEIINRPLTRFRSIFNQRDGILTPLERVRLQHPSSEIFFRHPDSDYASAISVIEGIQDAAELEPSEGDRTVSAGNMLDLLDGIGERIWQDLLIPEISIKYIKYPEYESGGELDSIDLKIVGNPDDLRIHRLAKFLPGSIVDTRSGPVVIDEGAEIGPFCYLQGPLYIGQFCRIDNARLTGGCVVGHHSRLGGEIENSIINDFSNKHHEGFLGHSILGSWVNLGALTTTSDLKNNYGEVRLSLPEKFIPENGGDLLSVSTGRIKFGSILGDCVKTAIGTMLNTGTVIDAASNIFGGAPEKYVTPLTWGKSGRYNSVRFLADSEKIAARRGQTLHPVTGDLVRRLAGKE